MIPLLLVLLTGCPILATFVSSQGWVSSLKLDRLPPSGHYAPLIVQPQPTLPAIEPTWTYITPLHWKHAPRGFHLSSTPANIAVLYPEGQYLEVETSLIKSDKGISIVQAGTRLLRTGTWSRTDDRVIRIQARVVFRNPPITGNPLPEPPSTETCGLEGKSPTHLAQTIRCPRLSFNPSRLDLDLSAVQRMAADAARN